jgi:hypothetical protein
MLKSILLYFDVCIVVQIQELLDLNLLLDSWVLILVILRPLAVPLEANSIESWSNTDFVKYEPKDDERNLEKLG